MLNTIFNVTAAAMLGLVAMLGHAHDHASQPVSQSVSQHTAHHARQHAAHVHGVAQLQVSVEGEQLYIALEAPADTLLGFHGAPANAEQQAREQTVKQLLNEPLSLWALPAEAQCRLETTELTWPTAAQLREHANIAAQWQLTCDAAKLAYVSLALWQHFAGLEQLKVELLTASGAQALELTRADKRLELH